MKNKNYIPDPRLHKYFSIVKSGVRILGFIYLMYDMTVASVLLLAAEAIGIAEECV